MPKKTFVNGQVLTDSDLNTYLMNQAVMTFASSAARSSAIGTATEGMVTYLEDSNSYFGWNGTVWKALSPNVINTISASYTAVASDANETIYVSGTAAVTVTFPDVFDIGDRIDIFRDTAATVALAAGTGVTSWGGAGTAGTAVTFKIDQTYNAASVLKVAANTYRVVGKITA